MAKTPGHPPAREGAIGQIRSGPVAGGPLHLIRALGDDKRGTAAIEFAIVAIPFFMFILMIFQVAIYHFGLQSLDSATRQAGRLIMTGTVPSGARSLDTFKTTVVCPKLLLAWNCSDVNVNIYKVALPSNSGSGTGIYQFFDKTAKTLRATPTSPTFCIGGPEDYIYIDVSYQLPSFMGSLLGTTAQKLFVIRSTNMFRNEPFKTGTAVC